MPKLTIDDHEIRVPAGTKVIQAAERLGIMIPRFCYHEAFGSLGACRVCAVSFKEGPVKGLEMSCMVEAEDGMVVSTRDPEALAFRKWIIECLMINHPLDCPVCDEGGHCLLQDETVSGGHGIRRYPGKKRTYMDQYLGPFIRHEMNRCIQCWRCRRFYQEFAGYRDLGAMQIANHTYFGRFLDGPLECPFSGNLIDVCPTGVFTDKPARFKGRRWNFERSPSVCIHCSLGCNTTGSALCREVVRQEARLNKEVNGYFICDRGRFGFDFANHPDRIREPRLKNREVTWDQGIHEVMAALKRIQREKGEDSILCMGSVRCSLETQGVLRDFCRLLKWPEPAYFLDPWVERKVMTAVARLDEGIAASMGRVEEADFIMALGVDPVNEAPMLALAMRQARRKDAVVVVADPRPVFLPFDFCHVPVVPRAFDSFAGALVREAVRGKIPEQLPARAKGFYESLPAKPGKGLGEKAGCLGRKLAASKNPLVICGTDLVGETTVALAADLAHLLKERIAGARLFYVLPGPNAFGAALMSSGGKPGFSLERIESGSVKALILVEQDPFWLYPDRDRLEKALGKLDYLLVLDYVPSEAVKKAHAVLPTAPLFERTPVTFVNQEGRVQKGMPLHRGGTPLLQISGGNHPPRAFLDSVPGGAPMAAHEVISEIYAMISGLDISLHAEALWKDLPGLSLDGPRLLPREPSGDVYTSAPSQPYPGEEGMELFLVDWTFGTEELSGYSRYTREAECAPCFQMHPDDAARLGLIVKDRIAVTVDGRTISLELRPAPSMAKGVLIAPRHRQVRWQKLKPGPVMVPDTQIYKL